MSAHTQRQTIEQDVDSAFLDTEADAESEATRRCTPIRGALTVAALAAAVVAIATKGWPVGSKMATANDFQGSKAFLPMGSTANLSVTALRTLLAAVEIERCEGGWRRGPIVVGGLSDSGTRGAKFILSEVGVTMSERVEQPSLDSHRMNKAVGKWMNSLISQVGGELSKGSFKAAPLFADACKQLCREVQEEWKDAGMPVGSWGFKSPRSILMVPIWDKLFRDDYTFVHVVRDPRAVCREAAHRVQYHLVCDSLLDNCTGVQGCFRYWAVVNGDVHKFFLESGKEEQYVEMSMEKIIQPEPTPVSPSFRYLREQLRKVNGSLAQEAIIGILQAEEPYREDYTAEHFQAKKHLTELFQKFTDAEPMAGQAALALGYSTSIFGMTDLA